MISVDDVKTMNPDPFVFAMANPVPEVLPEECAPFVKLMATGRSDYPNQINNVLAFPGIFRGALDARAPKITEEMKLAAARGIAEVVSDDELAEDYIVPSVFNRDVSAAVASAVAEKASAEAAPRSPRSEAGHRHGRDRLHRPAGGRRAARARRRGDGPLAQRARDRPLGRSDVASRRRPRRSPAATAWSTCSARTSRSAGPTRRGGASASRASSARGISSRASRGSTDGERPAALVSMSAIGFYGARGDERVDESEPAGDDFLAEVVQVWEAEARKAEALGMRVAIPRTGVVLAEGGGALDEDAAAVQARRRRPGRGRPPVRARGCTSTTSSAGCSSCSTAAAGPTT